MKRLHMIDTLDPEKTYCKKQAKTITIASVPAMSNCSPCIEEFWRRVALKVQMDPDVENPFEGL